MQTALYFPYIQVPQTAWFSQVLLYWDQAAAIVPEQARRQPDLLNPYMRELCDADLLQLIAPEEQLWKVDYESFNLGFLSMLERVRTPAAGAPRVRLHIGKMGYELFSELERRGMAGRDSGLGSEMWFQVEASVADQYMAYLAAVLSGTMENAVPVTDRSEAMAPLAGPAGTVHDRLAALRYTVVTKALPSPRGPVSPAELASFKDENADKLKRCRIHLDGTLANIAGIEDPALRNVRLEYELAAIADEVETLREKMHKRRWPEIALVGVGGVLAAALTTAAVVATGGAALAVGLSVGAGIAQLGVAGYSAAGLIGQPRLDPRAPLAYAALASGL